MNDSTELCKPHVPLAEFRVLYIGRAAPLATMDSIEAIQKPLCELYTKDECQSRDTDVDAVLTVLTSGLLMRPVNQLDKDLWLPVQNLRSCAAVKAVVGPLNGSAAELSFVPVDSPMAGPASPYPPVFSCVMGRSNGLPLTDCFAFICQSTEAAMLAVQATMHAFGNKAGWASDRPPKSALRVAAVQRREEYGGGGDMDDTPVEFFEKPPLNGFFYTPNPGLIQTFQIQGQGCAAENGYLRTPYIQPPPPPPAPPPAVVAPPDPPVVPMIFYETEQDSIFVDEPVRIQYPTISGPPPHPPQMMMMMQQQPGVSSRFGEFDPSSSIAFNPYLAPSADPPYIPVQPPPIARAMTTKIPVEEIFVPIENPPAVIPVVQEQFFSAPRTGDPTSNPIYQKRLPRSNLGVQQAYDRQEDIAPLARRGGAAVTGGGFAPAADPIPQDPFGVIKPSAEELYSRRLPPPAEEPLSSGARQFDSNFILQQSDTDKARIADIRNHEGYPVARPVNIADFGY